MLGGNFAVWGGLYSSFECSLVAIRHKVRQISHPSAFQPCTELGCQARLRPDIPEACCAESDITERSQPHGTACSQVQHATEYSLAPQQQPVSGCSRGLLRRMSSAVDLRRSLTSIP